MPRSPSRDLSDRFTGHRDYFRQPDGIRRWKYLLSGVALALAVGWGVFDRLAPSQAAITHTHGPLASPHAAWDNNCEACHKPGSASEVGFASIFTGTGERWRDLTCEKCHAGPAHHVTADAQNGCGSCHHDHQGRLNSLVNISDSHCTRCHANLNRVHPAGKPQYAGTVTSFARHPEFRPLAGFEPEKQRTLKFSHSLHMTPGQVYAKDARGAWTLGQLSEKDRERYRKPGQGDSAAVTLDCASCHQLDSGTGTKTFDEMVAALDGQPRRSIVPPRAEGAYFLPMNFDANCKACHPIKAPATTSGAVVLESFDLPHRRPIGDLKAVLEGEYARRLTEKDPKLAALPVTGGRLDPPVDKPEFAKFRAERDRLASDTLSSLLLAGGAGCAKCHDTTGSGEQTQIAPVPDRTVWFGHAKFNHARHRGVACAECHPNTTAAFKPDGTTEVVEKEPVRIKGVESCRECHAPKGHDALGPVGGVRHGCTDCHRYHNGDHALQGRGALARDPVEPLNVREFLRGGP